MKTLIATLVLFLSFFAQESSAKEARSVCIRDTIQATDEYGVWVLMNMSPIGQKPSPRPLGCEWLSKLPVMPDFMPQKIAGEKFRPDGVISTWTWVLVAPDKDKKQ